MVINKRAFAGLLAALWAVCAAVPSAPAAELAQPTFLTNPSYSADDYVPFAAPRQVPEPYVSPTAHPTDDQAPPEPRAKAEPKQGIKEEAQEEKKEEEEKKEDEEEKPWKLFDGRWLKCHNIDVRGWLDQGITWNPERPVDRFNGPVGYNDLANEYQLNQLYLIAERVTKTDGCGWDIGGRVDLLYGTDRRYVTAFGLDSDWNDSHFYGLAMPQAYVDVAVNNLIVRGGHFLAPVGYESVMAPENFFYSHTYSFLYGQPTTLSGGQLIYKLNDRLSINGGLDTGWNDWESPSERINYFGGFNWTSKDEKTTLAWEMFLGNTSPAETIDSMRTHYYLVLTRKLGEKWRYVLEHNLGYDTNNPFNLGTHGDWWAFAQYLIYDLNKCWSFAARYEYFSDDDGTVVQRVGPPTAGPVPARYSALSLGMNYKPSANVTLRSEIRWDWDASSAPAGQLPFDAGTRNNQFLWGTDLIVRF
jgi:hypothetical protein